MKTIGMWLAIFGVGSFVLGQFEMEFRLLSWIDNWGVATGNLIRGGMALGGAALWFLGQRAEAAPPAA